MLIWALSTHRHPPSFSEMKDSLICFTFRNLSLDADDCLYRRKRDFFTKIWKNSIRKIPRSGLCCKIHQKIMIFDAQINRKIFIVLVSQMCSYAFQRLEKVKGSLRKHLETIWEHHQKSAPELWAALFTTPVTTVSFKIECMDSKKY